MSKPHGGPRTSRRGGLFLKLILPMLVVAGAGGAYFGLKGDDAKAVNMTGPKAGAIKWRVQRQDLTISALAPGELRTKNMVEVRSDVSTYKQLKITWIIPEGSEVKAGDKLIEIDSSELNENYLQQKIKLMDALQNVQAAEGDLKIAEKKLETDTLAAQNKVEIAKVDLKKYDLGDFPQLVRKSESSVAIADEELRRAKDRLEWTEKLAAKDYVTKNDLEADQFAVTKTKISRDLAQQDGELLKKYTREVDLKKLETALIEAEGLLSQIKLTGDRDLSTKRANLAATKEKSNLEQITTDNLKDQVSNTVIKAPKGGLVVYHKDRNRFGSQDSVLQVGSSVYPRQALIDLPDFSSWIIEARVHESMIRKVQMGQMAFVTLDALPDELLQGTVSQISVLPDSSNWMRDTQEYIVRIDLSRNLRNFKPGMSGKTEIVIKELKSVIAVPVQAIDVKDGKTIAYVAGEAGAQVQEVEVGNNNDKFIEITKGLEEGQEIYLQEAASAGSGLGARPSERASEGDRQQAGDAADTAQKAAPKGKRGGQGGGQGGGPAGEGAVPAAGPGAAPGPAAQGGGGRRGNFDPSTMTPEQREEMKKKMEERMKDMTPEQRAAAEQRMKQYTTQAPGGAAPGGAAPGAPPAASPQGGPPQGGAR